jgi:sugar phosphate isomerase/epimerase
MSLRLDRRRFLHTGALGAVAAALADGRPAQAIPPVARSTPSRLKLSCCAYSYRQHLSGKDRSMAIEQFIDLCAGMGLDGVELTSYYFEQATPEYDHALRRRCFLAGLDVSGAALGNTFTVAPGPERDRQLAAVRQWIDRAVALGAPSLRVFGGGTPKGVAREEALQWAIDCLREAAVHARERGVYLALENHGGVTETPDDVLKVLQSVESDWVGANLDTGNFHGDDPYADVAQVAPHAVNVHLKATMAARGRPAQPADFPRIVRILREAKYSGYLSLEYESAEDPMTAVPRLIAQVRAAMATPPGGPP